MRAATVSGLKLAPNNGTRAPVPSNLLSCGVEVEGNLREIEHPEGRFHRADGTRYDVCVMEIMVDPTLCPPSVSRSSFVGDSADSRSAVIRLGNVRMSSFRLYLISPGEACGTLFGNGKARGASTR